jgi:hypothetical protein
MSSNGRAISPLVSTPTCGQAPIWAMPTWLTLTPVIL